MMMTIKTLMINDDQAITIFQTMHFREPLISKTPKILALNHVLVYSY